MTPAQAQMLLGIAASFDNRKPSEEAAVAWSVALRGLRFEDCRDAIVEHYVARPDDWLAPGHIVAIVKRVRAKRIHDHPPLTPPPDLTPMETTAWLAEARGRIGNGEVIDCDAAYGVLRSRHLPDLKALMPSTTESEAS